MQIFFLSILLISFFCGYAEAIDVTSEKRLRQIVTCENEKSLFWTLSWAAYFTSHKRVSKMSGGEKIHFETKDKIKLRGIKLAAEIPSDTYILIMQGNGFPAGRLVQEFERFQKKGIDVYAFDFRGYEKSGGKSRLWAMLQDYSEILSWLNSRYNKRIVYATSFGGVIASNVITDYSKYNLVLFDSVVSRVSSIIKCDRNYDPVDKLTDSCSSLIVQANSKDRFYVGGYLSGLMGSAKQCGGQALIQGNLEHPFEESKKDISTRMDKLEELVESHL